MPTCTHLLERFTMITSEELTKIVYVMNMTTCSSDPFPSKLLMSHLPTIIDTIMHIINLCLSTSIGVGISLRFGWVGMGVVGRKVEANA